MGELLSLFVVGFMFLAAVLVVRALEAARWQRNLVAYTLRFPRGLEASAVAAAIAGLSGLVAPWWARPLSVRAVVLEAIATADGIRHHLLMPRSFAGIVMSQVRATLPGIRMEEDAEYAAPAVVTASEFGLSSWTRPLRTDQPEAVAAAMLAALQPLASGEALVVQWTLQPAGPVPALRLKRPGQRDAEDFLSGFTNSLRNADALRSARAKHATPVFLSQLRIGVTVPDRGRARQLLQRAAAPLHLANAPGVHFRRRVLRAAWVAHRLVAHRLPLLRYPCLLNATELASLIAWPMGEHPVAGLAQGSARQLPPPVGLRMRGRVLAWSNFPGVARPLALTPAAALRHLHVIGPTGTGKSTLLAHAILSDIRAGYGVVVIDPKADLVDDVLARLDEHVLRRDGDGEVVLLDPTDDARPVGLNVLAGGPPELVVDQVVGLFQDLWKAFWGPRTDDVLRSALLTLTAVPGTTLAEVPAVLTDRAYRERIVGGRDDYVLAGFWAWYEGLSDGERAQAIGPVMNKLRAFLLRRRIRHVIGQAEPRFSFETALARRQIVLVRLNKGALGDEAAALLGSLVVARLWQATQARAGRPASERPPVFAYIDELQDYLHLPTSIGDVLAQARGLGLGLTLAHQHLGQLPAAIRAAVLANCASRVIFQVAADDARVLARELTPHVTAADLQGLEPYEVVARLATDTGVAAPATGTTRPLSPVTGHAELIRARSRQRFGVDAGEVERALRQRQERGGSGAIGRKGAS